jgi:hypothetical protein
MKIHVFNAEAIIDYPHLHVHVLLAFLMTVIVLSVFVIIKRIFKRIKNKIEKNDV